MSKGCHIYIDTKGKFYKNWSIFNIVISEESINNYLKLYNKFKDNKLKKDTTVYLTPMSLMPSYKLKNHSEENKLNVSLARKLEKLDSLIISDQFIRESYIPKEYKKDIKVYHIIPYDIITKEFYKFINTKNIWSDIRYHDRSGNTYDFYYISESNIQNYASTIDPKFRQLLGYPSITGHLINSGWGSKKAIDNYEFFENLKNITTKHNLDIIFDSNVNSEINKGTVIDLESFQTLYSMLDSDDKGNHSLAQEIIANSDFEQSKPYIIFLANIFSQLQNKSGNKNYHMIHKAIMEHKYVTNYNYNEFIQCFVEQYPQYKQIVCDCLVTHINNLCKTSLVKEIHSLF